MVILYNCCTMHNTTHSVHNRLLKMWQACLPRPWPSCYVSSPPLSEANCQPFPPPSGPGPPASNMAPFSPESTHTSPLLSVTVLLCWKHNSSQSSFQAVLSEMWGFLLNFLYHKFKDHNPFLWYYLKLKYRMGIIDSPTEHIITLRITSEHITSEHINTERITS
jgi:hypothetical protein